MLAGFRSRWMMPASCAASIASASWRAIATASVTDIAPDSSRSASVDAVHVLEDQRANGVLFRQAIDAMRCRDG